MPRGFFARFFFGNSALRHAYSLQRLHMAGTHVKYLLIGTGTAGCSAAVAIRERDRNGSMLVIGAEINRPYDRTALSKTFLQRTRPREVLFTVASDWFSRNTVQLRTRCRAVHLDVARRSVTLDSGESIAFDQLLLATGAVPKRLGIPGDDLPNVFSLRSLDDADRLGHAIDTAKADGRPHDRGRGRVAVIGGSWLGIEIAASLTQLGLAVDLLVPGDRPWEKFAGPTIGGAMHAWLEQHGVTVQTHSRVIRLEGDGRVQRVIAIGERPIACDFAVACVGSVIPKDLLRGTSLAAETAILIDSHACTSAPGIYAAGDCAAILDPRFGKHRLVDHWNHATATGTLAGINMAGGNERFRGMEPLFSEVFGLKLTGWGESRLVYRYLTRGTPTTDPTTAVEIGVGADGRIAQVLMLGDSPEGAQLASLVERRVSVEGREEEIVNPAAALPV